MIQSEAEKWKVTALGRDTPEFVQWEIVILMMLFVSAYALNVLQLNYIFIYKN